LNLREHSVVSRRFLFSGRIHIQKMPRGNHCSFCRSFPIFSLEDKVAFEGGRAC